MTPASHHAACLLLCSVAVAGCASGRAPATVTPRAGPVSAAPTPQPRVLHEVEAGQSLWRIAKVYGVPLDALSQTNGIVDPTQLAIGQKLLVPGATALREVPPYPLPLPGAPPTIVPRREAPPGNLAWPVAGGRVLSPYGAARNGRPHRGLDIGGDSGQEVLAAHDGLVVYAGSTLRGYGKTVIVEHGAGLTTLYAHGSELLVREGDRVRRGQRIARIGRSGNASTDHCHFEVRLDDVAVDPREHLPADEGTR